MKIGILTLAAASLLAANAHALVVYGESNSDAAVSYESPTGAEAAAVKFGSASAVYLGGGWFITANHVNGASVSQNGHSAAVSYFDDTLYSSYGVDLKLFYVKPELLSAWDCLAPAALSASAYSSMKPSSYEYSYNFFTKKYSIKSYTKGDYLTLVGAGVGRDESSALGASDVSTGGSRILRSGEASYFLDTSSGGVPYIITMPEEIAGSAQAVDGDSGGGLFYDGGGGYCLVGVLASVSPSISHVYFNSYSNVSLVYDEHGNSSLGGEVQNRSLAFAVSLAPYIGEIGAIIATDPLAVPEAADFARVAGLCALLLAGLRRRAR